MDINISKPYSYIDDLLASIVPLFAKYIVNALDIFLYKKTTPLNESAYNAIIIHSKELSSDISCSLKKSAYSSLLRGEILQDYRGSK